MMNYCYLLPLAGKLNLTCHLHFSFFVVVLFYYLFKFIYFAILQYMEIVKVFVLVNCQ